MSIQALYKQTTRYRNVEETDINKWLETGKTNVLSDLDIVNLIEWASMAHDAEEECRGDTTEIYANQEANHAIRTKQIIYFHL